jgi:hypothetical protein
MLRDNPDTPGPTDMRCELEVVNQPQNGVDPNIKPFVLLVEDDAKTLDRKRKLLMSFEFDVLGVSTYDDAVGELWATPGIDLVCTDISLSRSRHDRLGIDFARLVRATFSELPVAGYSGYFEDHQLSDEERALFRISFPKGRLNSEGIESLAESCRVAAIEYRMNKLQRASSRRQSETTPGKGAARKRFQILRRFSVAEAQSRDTEAGVASRGFKLRLIRPTDVEVLTTPIAIWIRGAAGHFEAEVFGFPELFVVDESEERTLDRLASVMTQRLTSLEESGNALRLDEQRLLRMLIGVLRQAD